MVFGAIIFSLLNQFWLQMAANFIAFYQNAAISAILLLVF